MTGKRNIQWLLGELPGLVADGTLDEAAADRVRGRYGAAASEGRNWIGIVFSVLGALLMGAGILSLLAYNWTDLARPFRAALAFAPLLVGQWGAWRVIVSWREEVGPREGWGVFVTLAMGACMALISQTYHLGGDFDTFLLVWMLLCLPLAFLLRAVAPAILCLAGFSAWAILWKSDGGSGWWLWPLLGATLACSWDTLAEGKVRAGVLVLAASVAVPVAVGVSIAEGDCPSVWVFAFMGLFAAMQTCGVLWKDRRIPVGALRWIGSLGVLCLSVTLTFRGLWDALGWSEYAAGSGMDAAWGATVGLPFGLALASLALLGAAWRARRWDAFPLGAASLALAVGYSMEEIFAVLLFNAYLLAVGVAWIAMGVAARRIGRVNAGMFVVLLIVTLRFFDSGFGFVAKGIVFILLGAAFLAANVALARRFRRAAS